MIDTKHSLINLSHEAEVLFMQAGIQNSNTIIAFIFLRRLDCMLGPYENSIQEALSKYNKRVDEDILDSMLYKAAGELGFYNISGLNFSTLVSNENDIDFRFKVYIEGFSKSVKYILDYLRFNDIFPLLVKKHLLLRILTMFAQIDLSSDAFSCMELSNIINSLFERNYAGYSTGEHTTPLYLNDLLTDLLFCSDESELRQGKEFSVYDAACGIGGSLINCKMYINGMFNKSHVTLYGQEYNIEAAAIAKINLLLLGGNSDNIKLGNTLTQDKFINQKFDYSICTFPFGISWNYDKEAIKQEILNGTERYLNGLPSINDSSFLFIQHLLYKMSSTGRLVFITPASALFGGKDMGCENNVRRFLVENDMIDCIVNLHNALQPQTPINVYAWLITNKKLDNRKGRMQFIDVKDLNKDKIIKTYLDFKNTINSIIISNKEIGYYQLNIEQPIRDKSGHVKLMSDKPMADKKKRLTVSIPTGTNPEDYFKGSILPTIDKDSWIDYSSVAKRYEIKFPTILEDKVITARSPQTILNELFALENMIETEKQKILYGESTSVKENIHIGYPIDHLSDNWKQIPLHLLINAFRKEENIDVNKTNRFIEFKSKNGIGTLDNKHISDKGRAKFIRPNDIVIIRSMSRAGEIYLYDGEGDAYISSSYICFSLKEQIILPAFLYLYAQSLQFKNDMQSLLAKDTVIKYLNINSLSQIDIPVPPIEVQREMVSSVSATNDAITDLKIKLDKQIRLFEEYRESVISYAMIGKN